MVRLRLKTSDKFSGGRCLEQHAGPYQPYFRETPLMKLMIQCHDSLGLENFPTNYVTNTTKTKNKNVHWHQRQTDLPVLFLTRLKYEDSQDHVWGYYSVIESILGAGIDNKGAGKRISYSNGWLHKKELSFLSLVRPPDEADLYTLAKYTAEIVVGLGVVV